MKKPHGVIELWKTKERRKVSNEQEAGYRKIIGISQNQGLNGVPQLSYQTAALRVSRFWLNAFYHGGATTIQRMKLPYVLSRVGQEFAAWIWVGKAFV